MRWLVGRRLEGVDLVARGLELAFAEPTLQSCDERRASFGESGQGDRRIDDVELDQLVDPRDRQRERRADRVELVAQLGERGRVDARVLEAARYQIDTLQPVPDKPPRVAAPDVPLTSLRKR